MVGDTLKKASDSSGGNLIEIKNFGDAEYGVLVFDISSLYCFYMLSLMLIIDVTVK